MTATIDLPKRRELSLSGCALCCVLAAACQDTDLPSFAAPPDPPKPDGGEDGFAVDPYEALDAGGLAYDCEIGVVDDPLEPEYRALAPGGEIPIGGSGQSGLTARLALRVDGPSPLTRAFVELELINVLDGEVAEGRDLGLDEAVELDCDSDDVCYLLPIRAEISHLARLPELEGLLVRVDVTVYDESTSEVLARARTHGVLADN